MLRNRPRSHTAGEEQVWDFNPGLSDLKTNKVYRSGSRPEAKTTPSNLQNSIGKMVSTVLKNAKCEHEGVDTEAATAGSSDRH